MQGEKAIAWLSLSLRADRVDETTLTGIGFHLQEVRHATVVQPRENETAMAYAERLAAYNEPEALRALLDADTTGGDQGFVTDDSQQTLAATPLRSQRRSPGLADAQRR